MKNINEEARTENEDKAKDDPTDNDHANGENPADGDGVKHGDDTSSNDVDESSSPSKAKPPSLTKLLLLARPEFKALAFAFLLMIISEGTSLYNPILLAQAYECV